MFAGDNVNRGPVTNQNDVSMWMTSHWVQFELLDVHFGFYLFASIKVVVR